MAECELLAACAFLGGLEEDHPLAAKALKARFCHADAERCMGLRILRALGPGHKAADGPSVGPCDADPPAKRA